MKILNPKITYFDELYNIDDHYSHISRCAKICYASNSITDNKSFVEQLWKNNHRSMFRHVGVYYIIPEKIEIPDEYKSYINKVMVDSKWYVSTNLQCALECMQKYEKYQIPTSKAVLDEIFRKHKLIYITFCIETGIDITREYNRKSPNAISEQSTRYVDFIKKLGIVFKKCHWMRNLNPWKKFLVNTICKLDEWFYKISRSKYGLNLPPQDARWCLFLDTMSKVAYTYTVKEWEYIINMRLFDWTGVAHKDAKEIARHIKDELEKLGYRIEKYDKHSDEEDFNCGHI